MKFDSILRGQEIKEYEKVTLEGEVLDLGGEKRSHYLRLVRGDFEVTTVNISNEVGCDVVHDLEKTPLPFEDESYDAVVLNNTLEHIYHARELVQESVRVLKKGGKLIITVPLLFPVHPSPSDFWRFTSEGIERMLEEAGIKEYEIKPLGTGVATVSHHFYERLMPQSLQIVGYVLRPFSYITDKIIYSLRKKGSEQKREYYTLGYFVIGYK